MPDVERPPAIGRVHVLRSFDLAVEGVSYQLPLGAQRALAVLAVAGKPPHRSLVAAQLWPDQSEDRAGATLRTVLWQIRRVVPGAVVCSGSRLALAAEVEVDLHSAVCWAKRIEDGQYPLPGLDLETLFGHDVLPAWSDDWAVIERERFRQIRLHAMETLCRSLSSSGRHATAIEVGLLAVSADSLRESAQRVLIEAHLAEGNVSEAVRQYRSFEEELRDALGVGPSAALAALVPDRRNRRSAYVR